MAPSISQANKMFQSVSQALKEGPELGENLVRHADEIKKVISSHADHFKSAAKGHAEDPAKRNLFGTAVDLMKTFFTKFGMSAERYEKLADSARSFVSTLLKVPQDFSKQELDAANKGLMTDIKDGIARMSKHLRTHLEKTAEKPTA